MELHQQVKNSYTTQKLFNSLKPVGTTVSKKTKEELSEFQAALQSLSRNEGVAYSNTLRIVEHDGDRAPMAEPQHSRKHPGYIRNEFGGFFTS